MAQCVCYVSALASGGKYTERVVSVLLDVSTRAVDVRLGIDKPNEAVDWSSAMGEMRYNVEFNMQK